MAVSKLSSITASSTNLGATDQVVGVRSAADLLFTGQQILNYISANIAAGGDMLKANNLSDLAAKYTGFDNISVHGADIASAGTINLETATGNLVDVTGTTTITAITLSEGHYRIVRFTGALTLTNGASLVLPTGANITTAAGDFATFVGYAAGVVRCIGYFPATQANMRNLQGLGTAANPQFATIELGNASDTTLSRVSAGVAAVEGATLMTLSTASQAFSGGVVVTEFDNGTKSSGSYTPEPGNGPLQKVTNNGAHTLTASVNVGSMCLRVTNGASAGAITFSGFDKQLSSDAITTTNTNQYDIYIKITGKKTYQIVALQ